MDSFVYWWNQVIPQITVEDASTAFLQRRRWAVGLEQVLRSYLGILLAIQIRGYLDQDVGNESGKMAIFVRWKIPGDKKGCFHRPSFLPVMTPIVPHLPRGKKQAIGETDRQRQDASTPRCSNINIRAFNMTSNERGGILSYV